MKLTEDQIRDLTKVFDDIITSDSVAVQSAFQRLALISSLANNDEEGPFTALLHKLSWLENECKDLRRQVQILQTSSGGYNHDPVVIDLGHSTMATGPAIYSSGSINITPLTATEITGIDISYLGNLTITDTTK